MRTTIALTQGISFSRFSSVDDLARVVDSAFDLQHAQRRRRKTTPMP